MLVIAKENVNVFEKETTYFATKNNNIYTVVNGNKKVSYTENIFNKYFKK